ncbi:phosphatase PAP2 family protein [Neolewinella antarctica]|uniref:Membrane-associated phospholipid phosphatase n=1 Tax=Neolewinella antarctica TaxID=442734 RepID=A0ABX0X880_9BACT|nr:phosphatase PAP2 family protein [Neolewinella antarctica]NJC25406.1 membrane-associated phospholipid phosphatase [Neolewinella antarctica]
MIKSRLSFLFLLFAFCLSALLPAQGIRPYNPSNTTNAILLGLGTGITATSMYLDRRIPKLTEADIKGLDFDKIPPIDRYSTRHFSLKTDEFTDKLLLTSFASPFFLLLDETGRDNFDDMALLVFEGALINAALVNLTKVTVRRPRPFNYNPDVPSDLKLSKNSRFSFYSGHVATAAYFTMTTAQLYSDLHPGSSATPYVWAAAALIPATVAYGRMRAGKHFFTDVLIGFVTGTAVALTVPALHRRIRE